jgi:hypothetical protein
VTEKPELEASIAELEEQEQQTAHLSRGFAGEDARQLGK